MLIANEILGTPGLNYVIFEIYENGNKKYIKFFDEETQQWINDTDMSSASSIQATNGKFIITQNTKKSGFNRLLLGKYAMVAPCDNPHTFYSQDSQKIIYVAKTYKGNPVVAIAQKGLAGYSTNGSISDYRPPLKSEEGRSVVQKIVLPDTIKILDQTSLAGHNDLTEVVLPKNLFYISSYVFQYSFLNSLIIDGCENVDANAFSKIMGNQDGLNKKYTQITIIMNKEYDTKLLDGSSMPISFLAAHPDTIAAFQPDKSSYMPGANGYHMAPNRPESIIYYARNSKNMAASKEGRSYAVNTSFVTSIGFAPETHVINKLPLFGPWCHRLQNIYIEGLLVYGENVDWASSSTFEDLSTIEYNSKKYPPPSTPLKQIFYFTHSKQELIDSLGENGEAKLTQFLQGRTAIYNYRDPKQEDNDFIGFTYGGLHSIRDLKIYRTSNSGRYDINIKNPTQEKTQRDANVDGTIYMYSQIQNNTFNINFAFDNLYEEDIRFLKQTFNGKDVRELIFDEEPYKVYEAKITGTPNIQYVPFEHPTKGTVYKGTGSLTFTCYYPYAHTPTTVRHGKDGRFAIHYNSSPFEFSPYPTYHEWIDKVKLIPLYEDLSVDWTGYRIYNSNPSTPSNLPYTLTKTTTDLNDLKEVLTVYNRGELPAPFVFKFIGCLPKGTVLQINSQRLRIDERVYNLEINTKTGQITQLDFTNLNLPSGTWNTSNIPVGTFRGLQGRKAVKYSGSPFLTIPPSQTINNILQPVSIELIYDVEADSIITVQDFDTPNNSRLELDACNFMYGTLSIDYQFWYY